MNLNNIGHCYFDVTMTILYHVHRVYMKTWDKLQFLSFMILLYEEFYIEHILLAKK